jgi:hypothetical protein
VNPNELNLAFAHMIRCDSVATRVVALGLSPDDFPQEYEAWGVVWALVSDHIKRDHTLPSRTILQHEVDEYVQSAALNRKDTPQLANQIMAYCYDAIPQGDLQPTKIMQRDGVLQRMVDLWKVAPLRRMAGFEQDPTEGTRLLQEANQMYERTRIIPTVGKQEVFGEEFRSEHLNLPPPEKTGVNYIDIGMGGIRPSSFIGWLAESSGGKTTAGVQLAVESVLQGRTTMFLGYEQPIMGDMAERLYRYCMQMSRDEWNAVRGEGNEISPELADRCSQVEQTLSALQFYDMSGRIKGQGSGGTLEIKTLIEQSTLSGKKPDLVIIDWLMPMIMAMDGYSKLDWEDKSSWQRAESQTTRERINAQLNSLKTLVAETGIKLVLMHQIAPGAIQDKTPQYKPDWTVAAECKGFGMLMDYVFTFGRRDQATSCMWWYTPKARGHPIMSRIVKLDGANDRIIDVNSDFSAMEVGSAELGYFRSKSEAAKVAKEDQFD